MTSYIPNEIITVYLILIILTGINIFVSLLGFTILTNKLRRIKNKMANQEIELQGYVASFKASFQEIKDGVSRILANENTLLEKIEELKQNNPALRDELDEMKNLVDDSKSIAESVTEKPAPDENPDDNPDENPDDDDDEL